MNEAYQMRGTPKDQAPDYGTMLGMITMDNPQVSAEEVGWLVALYEGEGSLGLYWNGIRKHPYPRTTIVSTDLPYLERAESILGRCGVGANLRSHLPPPNNKPHWKPRHDLFVDGIKRCKKLMELIVPLMTDGTVKKQKAELILTFCNSRLSHNKAQAFVPYTAFER